MHPNAYITAKAIKDLHKTRKLAIRLEISLLSAEGKTPSQISRQLKVSRPTVYLWQQRYNEFGLKGLQQDLPRSGRKPTFTQEQAAAVVKKAQQYRQEKEGNPNIASLAKSTELSYGITRRILLNHDSESKAQLKTPPKKIILPTKKRKLNYEKENSLKKLSYQVSLTPQNGRITQKRLAQRCGLSQATISLALSGNLRLREKTRLKVQKVAREIGYSPNPNSSGLAHLRWNTAIRHTNLALLTGESLYPRYRQFHTVLKKEAAQRGYALEIIKLDKNSRLEALNKQLQERGTQGIILGMGMPTSLYTKLRATLHWSKLSALSLTRRVDWINMIKYPDPSKIIPHCLNQIKKFGYRSMSYISITPSHPEQLYPQILQVKEVSDTIRSQQALHITPDKHIDPLILDTFNPERQLEMISAHLRKHQPEVVLCNQDADYAILKKAVEKQHTPAFISLNKENSEDSNIAGIALYKNKGTARFIIEQMDRQIRNNQFGLPKVPTDHRLPFKSWVDGLSLPPQHKTISGSPQKESSSPLPLPAVPQTADFFQPLDLTSVANRARTIPGKWIGYASLPLPSGQHYFNKIPFQIISETSRQKHSAIMMQSLRTEEENREYPSRMDLPLQGRHQRCHILHTCGWVIGTEQFAHYTFAYCDHTEVTIPLISYDHSRLNQHFNPKNNYSPSSRSNIGDWFNSRPIDSQYFQKNASPINLPSNENEDTPRYYKLFTLTWENPHPEKELKSLRIESDPKEQTTLAVLAVTLEKL